MSQRNRLQAAEHRVQRRVPEIGVDDYLAQWQTPDSNGPVIARNQPVSALNERTSAFGYRTRIAAAGLFGLASVAVVGMISAISEAGVSTQRPTTLAVDTSSGISAKAIHENAIASAEPLALAPTTFALAVANPRKGGDAEVSASNAIVKELNVTRRLANEYLEEINWLQSHNSRLQQKIDDLDGETLALNHELLLLEMKVATLQADAQPQVQVHTIYNFVDVPIGGAVEQADDLPPASENNNVLAEHGTVSDQLEQQEEPEGAHTRDFYKEAQEMNLTTELIHDNQSAVYVADYSAESQYPQGMTDEPQAMDH